MPASVDFSIPVFNAYTVATAVGSASSGDWLGRGSAAIGDAIGSVHVTAHSSRRAVGVGAGLAALGLLLPWVNSFPGTSPFTGYLDRWGLASPGLWVVFLGLLALGAIAMATGRAGSWPVGLPALVAAAFLTGLVWPYAVGGFGRSIGIWAVVAAIVVLVVGGIIDRLGPRGHDEVASPG